MTSTVTSGAGTNSILAMESGTGNDTYYIDSLSDTITENNNVGTDIVYSNVSYTLPANVEKLILTGTADINGTGNALNNTLTGNSGANIMDGGLGADTMAGGFGNDTYFVNQQNDIVTEGLNAGTDTVISEVSYAYHKC